MYDAAVIGAGAAGLAAARALANAGRTAIVLEARDRIGGRILTRRDPRCPAPIELGAEFIHGRHDVTFDLLERARAAAIGEAGSYWERTGNRLEPAQAPFEEVSGVLDRFDGVRGDTSVTDFLQECARDPRLSGAAEWTRTLVEGFDAADPADASMRAIAQEWRGGASLQAPQFRPSCGYAPLMDVLAASLPPERVRVALQTVVESVAWEPGRVRVRVRRLGGVAEIEAGAAIVTLPVGVLQSGAVRFDPALPAEKLDALQHLAMGPVVKVALRFGTPFWIHRDDGRYEDAAFFFGRETAFPTFWTTYPTLSPLVVGWAGGPKARLFESAGEPEIVSRAVADFAHVLGVDPDDTAHRVEGAYVHDWQRDPYARGAYSYVKVEGCGAREALAAPLGDALYFAGEATAPQADAGTVAGALASGIRAAASVSPRSVQKRGADAG